MPLQPHKHNSTTSTSSTSKISKVKKSKAVPAKKTAGTMDQTKSERITATHIFFWHGILSNWYTATPFPGSRCFNILIPELDKLDIKHPALDSFASRLLKDHVFNCGEQWMMAMKGWFFEDESLDLARWVPDGKADDELEYRSLKDKMYGAKALREWAVDSRERLMWESTVCRVLRNKNPRQQKELGRKASGFDPEVWSAVNMACVMAACVARAEVDPALKEMYLTCGERRFVEGSPMDTIWGVGLHFSSAEIVDPALWRGENRLGVCHDQAADRIRMMANGGGSIGR